MKSTKFTWAVALTALSAGRAMTLPYISRAGDGGAGDPPEAWLMPLLGDALIGVTAVAVAVLLVARQTPTVWTAAIAWNAVAAFDALAAYVIETTAPWPSFFMLEAVGRPMFFAAAAIHAAIIGLLMTDDVKQRFGVRTDVDARVAVDVS